jgi:single-strand DNA-binding protein
MNKLFITGRVGRTPETRTISTGDTVCSFSLAVDNKRKGGQDQPPTWFKVSAWGKLGEICQRYLDKGKMATVVGPVSVSAYEAKEGGTRFSLDVRADDVEFLSAKEQDDAGQHAKSQPKPAPDGFTQVDDEDFDSLPF